MTSNWERMVHTLQDLGSLATYLAEAGADEVVEEAERAQELLDVAVGYARTIVRKKEEDVPVG